MNVLMYGWEFPPYINGGLGIACYEIVQSLLKKQHAINLILPQAKHVLPATPGVEFNADFKLFHLDSLLQPYMDDKRYQQQNPTHVNSNYGQNLFSEIERYAYEASLMAQNIEHDVIYAHDWLTIRAGIAARAISKKPLFFHVHSLEFDRGLQPNQQIYQIELEGLQQADRIFAVSQYTRDNIVQNYQIAPEKIDVVYNGIPGSYFIKPPTLNAKQKKLVLFLGRITHQKGPFYFVEAAKKILSVRDDIAFAIVGEGDLLPGLIEYVAKSNISSHVSFLGFLDRETVKAFYELSQVYVMPSVSEPFGLTSLEALISNVPVVISKQSGVAELLDDVFKVDYWDVQAMAEKIMALIDYPVLTYEMLKNSQRALMTINWDSSVQHMINVFNQYLEA